jgi:hypothetical protein
MESLSTQTYILDRTPTEQLDYEIDEKGKMDLEKAYSNWYNVVFIPLHDELERRGDKVNILWLLNESEILCHVSILSEEVFNLFYPGNNNYDIYLNGLKFYI